MIDFDLLEYYLNSPDFKDRYITPELEQIEREDALITRYLKSKNFSDDFAEIKKLIKKKGSMSNSPSTIDKEKAAHIRKFEIVYSALDFYKRNMGMIQERSNVTGIYHFFTHEEIRFEKLMKINVLKDKFFISATYIG